MLTHIHRLFTRPAAARPVREAIRRRPALEALEDRTNPSVVFSTFGNGTYAYNTSTSAFRQITTLKATEITEGTDGTLFASFNSGSTGTWKYVYSANRWTKIDAGVATDLDASDGNTLYGSFTTGTWRYSTAGAWSRLTTARATELAAVDGDTVFGTFSDGVWRYDAGHFLKLTAVTSDILGADRAGTLVAVFGNGTFSWDGAFHRLTPALAKDVAGPSGGFVYAAFGNGTYRFPANSTSFTRIDTSAASNVVVEQRDGGFDDARIYVSVNSGTWYNDGGWHRITTAIATAIAS